MKPSQMVSSGAVELAVYEWGSASAQRPTVILIHGYPDNAAIWHGAAAALAKQFHVVAYDVRGAGRSTRPRRTGDFALTHLVADLAAVVAAVSPDRPVHLVGHDWGSVQGWEAVTTDRLKGRVQSWTTISGPSLDHLGHWVQRRLRSGDPRQLLQAAKQGLHSWYVAAFHVPMLVPTMWKLGKARLVPALIAPLAGGVPAETWADQADGSGVAGLNLYRANVSQRLIRPRQRRAELPVLALVLKRDRFVTPETVEDLPRWVPNLWRRDIDAAHWVQVSHPQLLAEYVGEFVDFVETGTASPALQAARVVSAQEE